MGHNSGGTVTPSAAPTLAALLTVDGAGTGLDADLLDGLSSLDFEPMADRTVNTQAGDYTLALTDASKAVELSTTNTITIPANATVPFPVGTRIPLRATGSGGQLLIVAAAGGVTYVGPPYTNGYNIGVNRGEIVIIKTATNTWKGFLHSGGAAGYVDSSGRWCADGGFFSYNAATVAGVVLADATNIVVDSTTGTKIGTATTQKLGFYNATPVVQQATTGTSAGFTAGAGTTATHLSTFTGNSGTKAYTVGDIVLALKNLGLLAAS